MKISQMFPNRYATGEDLAGKPVTLTIARIATEKLTPKAGQPPVDKYVLFFTGAVKGVILSRTLAHQIASALGSDDTDAWIGQRIQLHPEPMMVAGTPRIAIRARKAPNGETTPPESMQDPDED
jgi:hypothetical protein